jgi:hypothetical protein
MKRLAAIASPKMRVASRVASTKSTLSAPAASTRARLSLSAGKARSGFPVKAPVITSSVFATTRVTPLADRGQRGPAGGHDEVATQQQRRGAGRDAGLPIWPGAGASFRWLTTAPPFWASPTMSRATTPLPSRCAAMPRIAAMVMTPVPPTPVTTMP